MFQIWLAIAAVAKRNTIQVIGLVIFNFAFLLFSAFQIKESHNVIFGGNDVWHPTRISCFRQFLTLTGHDIGGIHYLFWTLHRRSWLPNRKRELLA